MTTDAAATRSLRRTALTILTGTAAGCLATCIALLFHYLTLARGTWDLMGPAARARHVLQGITSGPSVLHSAAWVAVFALAYRQSSWLRRGARDTLGVVVIALAMGTAISVVDGKLGLLILHHLPFAEFRSLFNFLFTIVPQGFYGWIENVLFIAPAIVWSIAWGVPIVLRHAANEPAPSARDEPPAIAASPNAPVGAMSSGLALIALSILLVLWTRASPAVGYLLILGALSGIGITVLIVFGAALLVRGVWNYFEWPGRQWAQIAPILIAVGAFLVTMLRPGLQPR